MARSTRLQGREFDQELEPDVKLSMIVGRASGLVSLGALALLMGVAGLAATGSF